MYVCVHVYMYIGIRSYQSCAYMHYIHTYLHTLVIHLVHIYITLYTYIHTHTRTYLHTHTELLWRERAVQNSVLFPD